jgi:hypothetical protein
MWTAGRVGSWPNRPGRLEHGLGDTAPQRQVAADTHGSVPGADFRRVKRCHINELVWHDGAP